ncbi:cation:proton antiporter [Haloarcula taiwanensis]|uniref:Cation:proton antiporter n=1 Tax=Haloarcula taiwanensis TaxID=1932004 RepID=A0A2H4ZW33_9EURY|nr:MULTISPECIES: cation:proton antiporter [Haloarcula]AUG46660.1 cation:proton antiporter [Haloarcula taiwanensis]RLM36862.1 monovalent cation/H+ antiporter subunit D family protein [Haloarcula sp. Atlit-120R]RLM44749.1 monovalent cation/H+ antiporter subunit D family protein [Haloarcula sp. Atlit-47R]
MTESLRPILAILVSAVAIPVILSLKRRPNLREGVTLTVAFAKFAIIASMVPGVLSGTEYEFVIGQFATGIELAFTVDPLGLLFGLLASLLWIVTSFYSIGYMRGLDEHAQTRYFASFAASLASAVGVAFASNLLTLFVCYELLTVSTYPLVTHDETDEARAAGRKYLAYTFGGGVAVLGGTVLVFVLAGTTAFTPGGLEGLATADPTLARAAFALLAAGFGVKAALMPMHSWLPDAMVAPTPVSGLLHAVAVVKSGVFGIARVVLDVYGTGTMEQLGVGLPLAAIAAFTLLTASIIALRQDNLKRRLAYSTISQLSYIVLGLGLLHGQALTGGLLHIPAHAFMKLTLFFCAGAIHVETHTDDISDMAGIGKRMPLTMAAFAVAAAGMAGIPLVAGFVSKWYLVIGALSLESGGLVFAAALLVSGVLNIAYFWPIVYQAYFESPESHDEKPLIEGPFGGRDEIRADGGEDHDSDATGGHSDEDEVPKPEHVDHLGKHDEEHEHHGGPPAGGWDDRGWRGGESTWFMLGPILTAATLSLLLGTVPYTAVFLRIVDTIVGNLPGVMA